MYRKKATFISQSLVFFIVNLLCNSPMHPTAIAACQASVGLQRCQPLALSSPPRLPLLLSTLCPAAGSLSCLQLVGGPCFCLRSRSLKVKATGPNHQIVVACCSHASQQRRRWSGNGGWMVGSDRNNLRKKGGAFLMVHWWCIDIWIVFKFWLFDCLVCGAPYFIQCTTALAFVQFFSIGLCFNKIEGAKKKVRL